jgi:hypothetical protein
MYHLFESEMASVSALNGVALTCFSISSLFLNAAIAIFVGWGFSSTPLSELGHLMLSKVVWYVLLFALLVFGGGIYCVFTKKSIVDQIKKETVSYPPPTIMQQVASVAPAPIPQSLESTTHAD